MMENDKSLQDEFLRNMVAKSTSATPSGDFVEKVMGRIRVQPVVIHESGPVMVFLKSSAGYFLLAAVVVVFFITSDIPFMNWIPGKQYFLHNFLPYFNSLFTGLKSLSESGRTLSIPLMIIAASGLFFLVDKILTNRNSVRHDPSV
jgi:hypothetical protein